MARGAEGAWGRRPVLVVGHEECERPRLIAGFLPQNIGASVVAADLVVAALSAGPSIEQFENAHVAVLDRKRSGHGPTVFLRALHGDVDLHP